MKHIKTLNQANLKASAAKGGCGEVRKVIGKKTGFMGGTEPCPSFFIEDGQEA